MIDVNKPIELEAIELKKEDLLFTKHFIKSLGGKRNARAHLLDIIDRYFNPEYLDPELFA